MPCQESLFLPALGVISVGVLPLDLPISAADHDLALAAAFRMATGRINGVALVFEVPRGPVAATALYVPSTVPIGGHVVSPSITHNSVYRSVLEQMISEDPQRGTIWTLAWLQLSQRNVKQGGP